MDASPLRDSQASVGSNRSYRIYQGAVLRFYDLWVHGISNSWFWGFSTQHLQQLYREQLSDNHLELGVGTGKFLADNLKPESVQRLVLADASPACLYYSKRRLARFGITTDSLREIDLARESDNSAFPEDGFSSIGLNYVLHCLPTVDVKHRAIKLASGKLASRGVLFGATLIGSPDSPNARTRRLERYYQSKGIFGNQDDSRRTIVELLEGGFAEVDTTLRGRALFFVARRPLRS